MANPDESYLLHFGGLGIPWFRDLRSLYKEPGMEEAFSLLFRILEQEAPLISATPALPQGLGLREWLGDGKVTPGSGYAYRAAVCIPMIFSAQAFLFRQLAERTGIPALKEGVKAAWGHSLGILGGAFASLLLNGKPWDPLFRDFLRYLIRYGIRSDEFRLGRVSFPAHADGEAYPMATLSGCGAEEAAAIARAANAGRAEGEQVHIGLRNLARNTVLCGEPDSLERLRREREDSFLLSGIKFAYVRTSCPFHSPLMAGMMPAFSQDIAEMGFAYAGSDLGLPVYSGHDGRDLRSEPDLGHSVLEEWCVRSIDWRGHSARIMRDHPGATILDFGPGSGSRALLSELRKELEAECAPALPAILDCRALAAADPATA